MEKQGKGTKLGKLLLLLVAVAWGSSMVVIKGSTDYMEPGTLLAMRFSLASIALAIISGKKLKMLNKDYIISGLIIGLCLFCAYFTQTIGVMLEMPGKSHFLSSAYCVFVPFLGWAFLKQRPNRYNVSAAVMCSIGIILVSLAGGEGFSISLGDSTSILSSVFWASQIVAIARFGKGKDPMLITMLQFIVSAGLSWIYALIFENVGSVEINAAAVGGVLYLGLICSCTCFLLQTIAQKTEDPTSVSIILSFENIFGIIFGIIFFSEQLTVRSVIGFSLMFVAIIVSETELSFLHKGEK